MWNKEEIERLLRKQQDFFRTGKTLDTSFRIRQLKRLKEAVIRYESRIETAIRQDLGRAMSEAYFCDVGTVIRELNEMIRMVPFWNRPGTNFPGLLCFPSVRTKVYRMPYGSVLIMSPFNFPFTLSLGPLADALAAGNTAVLKASSKSSHSTEVLIELIEETFPEKYVAVIDGGHEVADLCLEMPFDRIFYTGSPKVGRHVLKKAADNLVPATLELGGETGNWCVIRKDADLRDAARKIAFFKMLGSGQICININQVAVAEEVAEDFIVELKKEILRQIGPDSIHNREYPSLINDQAYRSCALEAERYSDRIIFGGVGDPKSRKYAPTLIYPVSPEEDIVGHELFNPLLPIVPYRDDQVDELLNLIADREHGLAFYIFTGNVKWAEKVMRSQQFGGGCINEVCLHMMAGGAPFGGTGHSGMGAYHGRWGYEEFTHPQSVLYGSTHFNLPLREHPYSGVGGMIKMAMIRLMER